MNEKEFKRIERKFDEFGAERGFDWSHSLAESTELWRWVEAEILRAYHKGYMEGTMEAL